MPALHKLIDRINADPLWLESHNLNKPQAQEIAENLHLMHVLRAKGEALDQQEVVRLLTDGPHELVVPAPNAERATEGTADTEKRHTLRPCLYLYAGRTFPKFGVAAFAFGADCDKAQAGEAFPFDTGGVQAKHICFAPEKTDTEVEQFVQESRIAPLQTWRSDFALYLGGYFDSLPRYWAKGNKDADPGPWKPDPDGIFFHPDNTWQSWAFEIHFYHNQDIFVCEKYDLTEGIYQALEKWSENATNVTKEQEQRIERILERGLRRPDQPYNGSPEAVYALEQWVRSERGI